MTRERLLETVYVLAVARLRAALSAHLDEHGCGTGDPQDPRYVGGFFRCPTAAHLWDLLPPSEQIVMA